MQWRQSLMSMCKINKQHTHMMMMVQPRCKHSDHDMATGHLQVLWQVELQAALFLILLAMLCCCSLVLKGCAAVGIRSVLHMWGMSLLCPCCCVLSCCAVSSCAMSCCAMSSCAVLLCVRHVCLAVHVQLSSNVLYDWPVLVVSRLSSSLQPYTVCFQTCSG